MVRPEPSVSIVIPSFNSPVVGKAIESIRRQAYPPAKMEIVVVGQDIYRQVQADDLVHFVETASRVYPGVARNIGTAHAQGQYVVFLDSDCVAADGWLAAHLRNHAEGDCVVSGSADFEVGNYWTLCDNVACFHDYRPERKKEKRKSLASANLSMPRGLALENGPFDPVLYGGEDLDLTARLYRLGVPLWFEPEAMVYHNPNRDSLRSLVQHHLHYGKHSIVIRKKYPDVFGRWLPTRWPLLILGAPAIAGYATWRVFALNPVLRRYWRTLPIVYLTKLLYCQSAAQALRKGVRPPEWGVAAAGG